MSKGVLAQQVLENPVYNEAMIATKAHIFDQWVSTKWFQYRKRQELWRLYRAAEIIEGKLDRWIKTAKLEDFNQQESARLKNVS